VVLEVNVNGDDDETLNLWRGADLPNVTPDGNAVRVDLAASSDCRLE
jgi:hypothetical protein